MNFPQLRLRRLRRNERMRRLVRETSLSVDDLVYPLFVRPGKGVKIPISAMVGHFQLSIDQIIQEVDEVERLRIPGAILFGIPEEKIQVIYNGVAAHFSQIEDKGAIEQVLKKYGIDGNYILFVGKLEARKNLAGLIEAFRLFKKESKLEHKMVLVGSLGWKAEEILEKLDEYGLQEDVVRLGYVCDEDLPFLMNGADVFLYPSLYEGFGIPALEAMACGTPVVASNTTSLPEVVGDTGLLVDPTSPGEIAEALTRILVDSALRKTLIVKGIERAASFTWRHAAEQTLRLYQEMLK